MLMTERAPPTSSAPDDPERAALRIAIAEREAAKARHQHAEQAERLGRELHSAAERVLIAFGDTDAAIVEHRAEEFKRAATGALLLDLNLPDNLAARRTMRDEARAHVTAAKAAHEGLVADLVQAESALLQAGRKVATAAIDVLAAEGARRVDALQAAWNDVWRQYDRLSALADCWLEYAGSSLPITLPPDIVKLLQALAALDGRDFPDGRNRAAAAAGDVWCCWFEALLSDAEAEVTFRSKEPAAGAGDPLIA